MQNIGKGLGGLLKGVSDITGAVNNANRTANSAKRAGQDVKKTVGTLGKKKDGQKAQAKDAPWTCECGVANTTKFCAGCGKPAPAPLKCPKCKWVRPVENSSLKFCGNCGAQLEN